eukprot:1777120-Lingulodinium_polyedra.AAC.1
MGLPMPAPHVRACCAPGLHGALAHLPGHARSVHAFPCHACHGRSPGVHHAAAVGGCCFGDRVFAFGSGFAVWALAVGFGGAR